MVGDKDIGTMRSVQLSARVFTCRPCYSYGGALVHLLLPQKVKHPFFVGLKCEKKDSRNKILFLKTFSRFILPCSISCVTEVGSFFREGPESKHLRLCGRRGLC